MPVSGSRRTSIVCSVSSMPSSGLKNDAVSTLRSKVMSPMRPLAGRFKSGADDTRTAAGGNDGHRWRPAAGGERARPSRSAAAGPRARRRGAPPPQARPAGGCGRVGQRGQQGPHRLVDLAVRPCGRPAGRRRTQLQNSRAPPSPSAVPVTQDFAASAPAPRACRPRRRTVPMTARGLPAGRAGRRLNPSPRRRRCCRRAGHALSYCGVATRIASDRCRAVRRRATCTGSSPAPQVAVARERRQGGDVELVDRHARRRLFRGRSGRGALVRAAARSRARSRPPARARGPAAAGSARGARPPARLGAAPARRLPERRPASVLMRTADSDGRAQQHAGEHVEADLEAVRQGRGRRQRAQARRGRAGSSWWRS